MLESPGHARILKQEGHHFLWIDGRLWMWDVPEEIEAQAGIARKARGEVLVAGYGLGVVQRFLLKNDEVRSVTTIERCQSVLFECRRVFGTLHGRVVLADFHELDRAWDGCYDTVVGDVWVDCSPGCLDDYARFKDRAARMVRPGGAILCWGQDYMDWLLRQREARAAVDWMVENGASVQDAEALVDMLTVHALREVFNRHTNAHPLPTGAAPPPLSVAPSMRVKDEDD